MSTEKQGMDEETFQYFLERFERLYRRISLKELNKEQFDQTVKKIACLSKAISLIVDFADISNTQDVSELFKAIAANGDKIESLTILNAPAGFIKLISESINEKSSIRKIAVKNSTLSKEDVQAFTKMLQKNKLINLLAIENLSLVEEATIQPIIQAVGKSNIIDLALKHAVSDQDCKDIVSCAQTNKNLVSVQLRAPSEISRKQKKLFTDSLTKTNIVNLDLGFDDEERKQQTGFNKTAVLICSKISKISDQDLHFLAMLHRLDQSTVDIFMHALERAYHIPAISIPEKEALEALYLEATKNLSPEQQKVLDAQIDGIIHPATAEFGKLISNQKSLELSHFALMPKELHGLVSNVLNAQQSKPLLQAFEEARQLDEKLKLQNEFQEDKKQEKGITVQEFQEFFTTHNVSYDKIKKKTEQHLYNFLLGIAGFIGDKSNLLSDAQKKLILQSLTALEKTSNGLLGKKALHILSQLREDFKGQDNAIVNAAVTEVFKNPGNDRDAMLKTVNALSNASKHQQQDSHNSSSASLFSGPSLFSGIRKTLVDKGISRDPKRQTQMLNDLEAIKKVNGEDSAIGKVASKLIVEIEALQTSQITNPSAKANAKNVGNNKNS